MTSVLASISESLSSIGSSRAPRSVRTLRQGPASMKSWRMVGRQAGRGARRVAGPAQGDPRRAPRLGVEGGADQHQAVDRGRVGGREVHRDLTAECDADDDRGRELVVEHPATQGIGQSGHVEGMDRLVAHPESRQVGRIDRPAGAERLDQRLQRAARGEAVDQDDRGRAELGRRAVAVRAVRVPGGLPLELLGTRTKTRVFPARVQPPYTPFRRPTSAIPRST